MPWKPGDDHDLARGELRADAARVDAGDPRLAVAAVGGDAGLRPGQADRRHAERVEGHRDERRALVLAGGQQDVELAGVGLVGDRRRERQQLVGGVAHRGHDDDELRPARALAHDPPRDPLDALGARDGRAAELHHDEGSGHGRHSSGGLRAGRRRPSRDRPAVSRPCGRSSWSTGAGCPPCPGSTTTAGPGRSGGRRAWCRDRASRAARRRPRRWSRCGSCRSSCPAAGRVDAVIVDARIASLNVTRTFADRDTPVSPAPGVRPETFGRLVSVEAVNAHVDARERVPGQVPDPRRDARLEAVPGGELRRRPERHGPRRRVVADGRGDPRVPGRVAQLHRRAGDRRGVEGFAEGDDDRRVASDRRRPGARRTGQPCGAVTSSATTARL